MNRAFAGKWAVAGVLATSLVAGACSRGDESLGPVPDMKVRGPVETTLEVSSPNAGIGQRIVVAVNTSANFVVGGLQGALKYDHSRLEYAGQLVDFANRSVILEGRTGLSIVTLNIGKAGLPNRSVLLAFQVKDVNYTNGMTYQLIGAGSPDNRVSLEKGHFAGVVFTNDLLVGGEFKKLSIADWKASVVSAGLARPDRQRPMLNPGELRTGLLFGDVNFNGTVNVFDVIDVQNVAAQSGAPAVQLLNGTDVTDRDMVLAANVAPANLPGYGGVGDNLPPGVAASGSSTNIDARVINVFDAIDVANGASILCNPADPTFNNFVSCHPIPGRDAASFSADSVVLSCPIVANRTLHSDSVYIIPTLGAGGRTDCFVGGNGDSTQAGQAPAGTPAVTLTVEPGTRIVGDSAATMVVARNGRIIADGTLAQPILFTCRRPRPCNKGAWGGLVISGNSVTNLGDGTPSPAITGRQGGGGNQNEGEGQAGHFGGNNVADSSGVLRFVILEWGGTRFTSTNERNGLTMSGVGSKTVVDYVQSNSSLDDAIESFGGTVNYRHIMSDNNEDDNNDWVQGWRGNAQFWIARGCASNCDNGIEADNQGIDGGSQDPEAAPRSSPVLSNYTMIGWSNAGATTTTGFHGMLLRMNTAATIRNFLMFDYKAGIDIDSVGYTSPFTSFSYGLICQKLGGPGVTTGAGDDSLNVRYGLMAGNAAVATSQYGQFSNADPDKDDPHFSAPVVAGTKTYNCGGYQHTDSTDATSGAIDNLELVYVKNPSNFIVDDIATPAGQGATTYLVAPYATIPDYRPKSTMAATLGLRSGSSGCAIDPTTLGSFFRPAPYCGAVAPQGATADIPWYAGWTNPR